jgi:hypothetical protein
MGILQSIRERLGVAPELPDSEALDQALGDKLQEINTVNAEILAHEERLPLDVIQSPDRGEASGRELVDLKSTRDRLTATCDALRREIAAAIKREATAEKIAELEATAEKGRACLPLAKALIEAMGPAVAAARAFLVAHKDFVKAIPMSDANEWEGNRRMAGLRQLIILALENPDAIEDAIRESVHVCTANAHQVRSRRENSNEPASGERAA